jgi:hypothetical protein
VVRPLLEARLQSSFDIAGSETCSVGLFDFFCGCPILNLWKNQTLQIVRSGEYGGCWNLVFHQKLLHCEGGVTRSIFMVQYPIVSPFFWPALLNGIAQML